jgi:hypothetical protein
MSRLTAAGSGSCAENCSERFLKILVYMILLMGFIAPRQFQRRGSRSGAGQFQKRVTVEK